MSQNSDTDAFDIWRLKKKKSKAVWKSQSFDILLVPKTKKKRCMCFFLLSTVMSRLRELGADAVVPPGQWRHPFERARDSPSTRRERMGSGITAQNTAPTVDAKKTEMSRYAVAV